MMNKLKTTLAATAAAMPLLIGALPAAAQEWTPTRNIEMVVPAGPGGSSDTLARTIQSIITKHELIDQSITVVNKPGANSAEGLLDVAMAEGDPHKLVVVLSNMFLVPLASDIAFEWTDLTPVAIVTFDDFVLWVNADEEFDDVAGFIEAAKAEGTTLKLGGTQAKQDDELLGRAIEAQTGIDISYIPFKSGGEVSTQLVGGHIDLNVGNPAENAGQWAAGEVKPLCVFSSEKISYTAEVANGKSWNDIPTCASEGLDVEFNVLRAVMMPGGVTEEQQAFYADVMSKVVETPEWKAYVEQNGLQDTFIAGEEARAYMEKDAERYRTQMSEAGFLHESKQ